MGGSVSGRDADGRLVRPRSRRVGTACVVCLQLDLAYSHTRRVIEKGQGACRGPCEPVGIGGHAWECVGVVCPAGWCAVGSALPAPWGLVAQQRLGLPVGGPRRARSRVPQRPPRAAARPESVPARHFSAAGRAGPNAKWRQPVAVATGAAGGAASTESLVRLAFWLRSHRSRTCKTVRVTRTMCTHGLNAGDSRCRSERFHQPADAEPFA